MTPRTYIRRSAILTTFGALAFAFAAACGGSSFESAGSSQRVKPGDPCSGTGQKAMSVDGCNTCSCSGGAWACTEMACVADAGVPNPCTPGASRTADDGCNTCTCAQDGTWGCTERACNTCAPIPMPNDG